MVTMSRVWDGTTDVLRGRSGILTRLALLALILPPVVRDGWAVFAGTATAATVLIGGLIGIVALLAMIWGQLAIVAVASDPATDQSHAMHLATRRFGPALGLYLIAAVVAVVLIAPIGVVLAGSGIDYAALSRGEPPQIAPATAGFVGLYLLVFLVAALFIGARFLVLTPVIVNERRGVRAFARSWSLTRGLTWRIVGVTLLFTIVWMVVSAAARLIVGIVLRLSLGDSPVVVFVLAVVAAVLAAAYSVIFSCFSAQLYAMVAPQRTADASA